jgi:MFS transporter, OFA family, oxalate/formate antiporter
MQTIHAEGSRPKPAGIYYGWVIVGLCFIVLMASYGLLFSYAVFAPKFVADLSLDSASVSAPFSVCVAAYAILGLVAGRLTDRFGPRSVIIAGGLLLIAGFAVLSQATELWHLFLGMSVLVGVAMSTPYIPTSATVVRWFVARRGLALAISSMGSGFSMVAGPAAASALIQWLGWRDALLVLGFLGGGLTIVSALGIRRDPGISSSVGQLEFAEIEQSWTLPEARRTRAFWIMCAIYFLTWGVMFFPYAHMVAIAVDLGFSTADGVTLFSIAGLAGLVGRPAIGWLSDKAGRKAGLLAMLAIQVVAFAVFAMWQSLEGLYLAAALFGMGASAGVTIYPAVVGDTFGRAHVGTIAGFAFAFTCSAGSLGPLAAGWLHDWSGEYTAAFWASAGVNALAMGLVFALRAPLRPAASLKHLA